jgi:2-keto-4-pentenoate hydratase/2-oxohepta-3-ene-1,7-dioic acid hydratase in catechol pathway
MRLLSFEIDTPLGSRKRVGAEEGQTRVLDLNLAFGEMLHCKNGLEMNAALAIADAVVSPDMLTFIEGGEFTLEHARAALEWAKASGDAELAWATFEGSRRLPVISNPPMLRDFMAFEGHLKNIYPRLNRDIPEEWYNLPVYYKGNPGNLGAHGQAIAIPEYCSNFDFEFEIAAIIGKSGVNIQEENALGHIFGLTIYNDFSARDIQMREMSVGLGPAKGKDFDTGHVLGPVIVTKDEFEDIYNIGLEAKVNDKLWCEGNTGDMHWKFEKMIAHASQNETLRVGEVFGSGTVAGGSAAEKGQSISAGDRISLSAEGIGTLENSVV